MNKENIICAAQARLNFCNKDYVNLYKEINNKIIEESRDKTAISVSTDVNAMILDKVIKELSDLGYSADYFHLKDKIFTINISW